MKLMKKLNQRQEIFCNQIFLGKSATESAIIAGYSPKTARFMASAILTKPNINEYISHLRLKSNSRIIADVSKRKEILTSIINDEHKSPITARDKVFAVAELNKMDGSYAPEKHAILGDILIEVVYADRNKGKDESPSNAADTPLPPG